MSAEEVRTLRSRGRWAEALELVEDPLVRADLLNEQALFAGDADARRAAESELRERDGFLPSVAAGLLTLAEVAFERGRDAEARELPARARGLGVESGADAFLRRIETTAAEHGA